MSLVWQIRLNEPVKKDISALDKPVAKCITRFLQERVAVAGNPRSLGAPHRGTELGEFWKYCLGDHRIIAAIEDRAISILVSQTGYR